MANSHAKWRRVPLAARIKGPVPILSYNIRSWIYRISEEKIMELESLRKDIAAEQKKGLPFIIASVILWGLITVIAALNIPLMTKNLLVFCCSCPLLPISWLVGKKLNVNIFSKQNPLGELGILFTVNQMIYLLIVMWVYAAVPEKMIMVHAMVFGAHLLPYSWLYRSNAYKIFAIVIPIVSLFLGNLFSGLSVAAAVTALEALFVILLFRELK